MFPFESRLGWHAKTGYLHLVEAIEGHVDEFAEPYRSILEARADRLRYAVTARAVAFVLVNLGLLATGLAWLATVLPAAEDLGFLVDQTARALTGFSLVMTVVLLLLMRYLGQLQADIVAAIALGTGRRIEEAEQEAKGETAEHPNA